ncbi:MAG: SAM-dependent methyltransferase [Planctomycetota bacterium]|jgi:SAM-dependent methyltransferase
MSCDAKQYEAAARKCAEQFLSRGRFSHGYVLGKLMRDPMYRQIVDRAPLAEPVVDLGCGRGQTGLMLALLYPGLQVVGHDWDADKLEWARDAAKGITGTERLSFESGDLRSMDYHEAKTLLMLDVLHYNPIEVQDEMLRRACACLLPRGRLFIRELDANGGWRAHTTIWVEKLGCMTGMNRGATLCFRSADSIEAILESCGLETCRSSSFEGTPLANVLIEAKRL